MGLITKPFEDYGFTTDYKPGLEEMGRFSVFSDGYKKTSVKVSFIKPEDIVNYTLKNSLGEIFLINALEGEFQDYEGLIMFMYEGQNRNFLLEEYRQGVMPGGSTITNLGKEGVYDLRVGKLDQYYGFSFFSKFHDEFGLMVKGVNLIENTYYPNFVANAWLFLPNYIRPIPKDFLDEFKKIYLHLTGPIIEGFAINGNLKKDFISFLHSLSKHPQTQK